MNRLPKPREIQVYDGDETDSLAEAREERIEREERAARAKLSGIESLKRSRLDLLKRYRPSKVNVGCVRFDIRWTGKYSGEAQVLPETDQDDSFDAVSDPVSSLLTRLHAKRQITSITLRTPGWDHPHDPYRIAIETIIYRPSVYAIEADTNQVFFGFQCERVEHINHASARRRARRARFLKATSK